MRLTKLQFSRFGKMKVAMETYFNQLNGVFCIYKPTGMSTKKAAGLLKQQVLKELNNLPGYDHEIEKFHKDRESLPPVSRGSSVPVKINVPETVKDYSKHKLVLGDMFISDDVWVQFTSPIDKYGSGVVVCSMGTEGKQYLKMIEKAKYLAVYHVKGRFGYATNNYFTDGHIIERTTFRHIDKAKLDKVCSAAQSGHQRLMFESAGVNQHSQEAYELASRGLIRPAEDSTMPILYGVKCIDFTPPDFILEVHAVNEENSYLAQLVNDIGIQLKSTAVCTHIHRLRYGIFNLRHTLLKKEWTIPEIARNIHNCKTLLTPENLFTNIRIGQKDTGGQPVDFLSESVTKNDELSKEEILEIRAREQLRELREQLLAEAKAQSKAGNAEHQKSFTQSKTGTEQKEMLTQTIADSVDSSKNKTEFDNLENSDGQLSCSDSNKS